MGQWIRRYKWALIISGATLIMLLVPAMLAQNHLLEDDTWKVGGFWGLIIGAIVSVLTMALGIFASWLFVLSGRPHERLTQSLTNNLRVAFIRMAQPDFFNTSSVSLRILDPAHTFEHTPVRTSI